MNTQQYIDSLDKILNNRWESIVGGILTSFVLILSTILIGAVLGLLLYLWKYSNSRSGKLFPWTLDNFLRYIPVSTWLVLVFYLFFRGNFRLSLIAAILALSLEYGCWVYRSISAAVEAIDEGEMEAAISMGYDRKLALYKIYFPRAMPDFLNTMRENTILHVRDTAVVEIISVMDIQAVSNIIAGETHEGFAPILITSVVYILFGICASRIFDYFIKESGKEKTPNEMKERFMNGRF